MVTPMTTKATKEDRLRARALFEFGTAIAKATRAYFAATGGIALCEGERDAARLAEVLADIALSSCADHPIYALTGHEGSRVRDRVDFVDLNVELLARMVDAVRPRVDGRTSAAAVATAVEIVELHAAAFVEWGNENPWRAVHELALTLTRRVHDSFIDLEKQVDEVARLLARYVPAAPRARRGKPGKNTARGTPTKITANGILVALNELADYPLGKRLSVKAIDNVRRARGGRA